MGASDGQAVIAIATLLAAGCTRQPPAPPALPPETPDPARQWTGRWSGPEGTWLEIHATGREYTVTIKDLDAARTFPAAVVAGGLSFERDGVRESIRATDGVATGMKWLAEKSDCLTVKPGEGYCRD